MATGVKQSASARGSGPFSMRLDKYLKVSRLVKRRTLANELCDGGKASLNGRTAKAAAEVKPDDTLALRFGNRLLQVRVLRVPEKAVSVQEAPTLYEVLEDTRSTEQIDK